MSGDERLGVVITTHDGVDDARINQELIRNVWGLPVQPVIVHAFNGEPGWYPEPYLEDELVRIQNNGHFRGATELIDAGCAALAKHDEIRYAVVLASDVWFLDGGYVSAVIGEMREEEIRIASVPWGYTDNRNPFGVGLATDFFIVDLAWAFEYGLLPLDYADFDARNGEMLFYHGAGRVSAEKLLMTRLQSACYREVGSDLDHFDETLRRIRPMNERDPIHPNKAGEPMSRTEEWPDINLITSHDVDRKRKVMSGVGVPPEAGPAIRALLESTGPNYSMPGASRD